MAQWPAGRTGASGLLLIPGQGLHLVAEDGLLHQAPVAVQTHARVAPAPHDGGSTTGTGTGGTARVLSEPPPLPALPLPALPLPALRHRLLAAAAAAGAPAQPLSARLACAALRSSPAAAAAHGALTHYRSGRTCHHGDPEGEGPGALGAPCRAKAEQR